MADLSAEEFIEKHVKPLYESVQKENEIRQPFQDSINDFADMVDWQKYIDFEIKEGKLLRAQHLYERALGSNLELESNNTLWLNYIFFIQEHLKDKTLVRAKYE